MAITFGKYVLCEETFLKALILTHGIEFSEKALKIADLEKAKRQNMVYNMPSCARANRPQELFISNGQDRYGVVVSCVSPNSRAVVKLDADESGRLIASLDGHIISNVEIHYVKEPSYYKTHLKNGDCVKKYVSACGLDELDIMPWRGCAVSRACRFCGINNYISPDELDAQKISHNIYAWKSYQKQYLDCLEEAVKIALKSDCYKEHVHVILIAGNLSNANLDFESAVFGDIAKRLFPLLCTVAAEGIVAVITPPQNFNEISRLKSCGIEKVVFNLEAVTKAGFQKYCPGKAHLGYNFFTDRLEYALEVFGSGNVWSNLVFGLEDKEETLEKSEFLIQKGIVLSANVLHLDKGNTLDCGIPSTMDTIDFFYRLEKANHAKGHLPFYCAKALRTSLSNEAHDFRIQELKEN